MFRAIGQFLTTTQFYLYGRNHFTLTGWEKAVSSFDVVTTEFISYY